MPNAANWRRKKWVEFSPFNVGYQVKLRELQTKLGVKKDTILKSLENESHEYFAFFVCRNPIEKLKSLYSYSLDLNRFKRGETPQSFRDFIVQVFRTNSTFSFNSFHFSPTPFFSFFAHPNPGRNMTIRILDEKKNSTWR